MGNDALVNNTGSGNIALGSRAGYFLTTGDNNIFIGNEGSAAESKIIRIGSGQTDTYLVGVIHGDGSGLTNVAEYAPKLYRPSETLKPSRVVFTMLSRPPEK